MFAGPNGSGKSTVKGGLELLLPPGGIGVYVNPDELEAALCRDGRLPLTPFRVTARDAEARDWFTSSSLMGKNGLADAMAAVTCWGNVLDFGGVEVNSYHASVLADFLRRKLIATRVPFSFETVMSHQDKVRILQDGRQAGFRTYLYYVATEDPAINVGRVRLRVSQGGHDVPESKIVERYTRSLGLLREAIRHADRAYFFDTSETEPWFVAEITAGQTIEFQSNEMPNWFKTAVYDKF